MSFIFLGISIYELLSWTRNSIASQNSATHHAQSNVTVNRDAQGNFERFKARLVVQEVGQEFGSDYYETYAPVIRIENVILFAMGACFYGRGVATTHVDLNNAFQNDGADYRIYIRQPPGFTNRQLPQYVLPLLELLYCLKQESEFGIVGAGEGGHNDERNPI
jgi:hypothetical protein